MTDKKMTSQTPIVIRKRICYNRSLREFFNNIHRILRGQNWINRQQNIRFQFTLSCLHTVLKNDEKADFKKQKIKKNVTYISQSNKVVFSKIHLDLSDSVQVVWMSVLTGRLVVQLRKHRLF